VAERIKGMIAARKMFASLPEHQRDLVVDVHTQSAAAIVRAARGRVRKRTGLLARSIEYSVSERTGFGQVGIAKGQAYYGHFVEFGTIHQPAHPFMLPSVEEERGQLESRFQTAGLKMERKLESIGGRNL
jgi:HK97 gp10 family phage protein